MTKRQLPAVRQAEILKAAVKLSRKQGYTHVSRDAVATAAECSPGLVSAYFGTMVKLRRAIIGEAIRTRDLEIIAQGLAARDKRTMNVPEELRRAALNNLMG